MKEFIVSFGSNIVGSHDYVYVVAKNESEALTINNRRTLVTLAMS